MKLTYQTGIAALIQLAVMTLLNIANGFYSSIKQCTTAGNGCVEDIILALLYFMVLTTWFAFVWILAAAAQDRRSRRMALLLIASEGMIALVSLFNARHHNNILGLVTSLTDAALALWVAFLALRLMRARGGRVTSSPRARQRRLSKD